MGTHVYRYILMCLTCTLCLLLVLSPVQAQQAYHYAYFKVSQFGESVELNIVNQTGTSVRRQAYPLPSGLVISTPQLQSLVSPNGEWIASPLFSIDNTRLVIQIYNPVSGEARQVIEGYITRKGDSVAWSPDSRYLALVVGQGTGSLELFVYSIADGSLTNLTNDDFDQSDVAWWPDSSRIATFMRPCTVNISCVEQLEVYELRSRSRTASIDLSSLPILGHSACNPKISPDGQYIAFISNCGIGIAMAMDFPNEVYLANWRTGELANWRTGASYGVRPRNVSRNIHRNLQSCVVR
jgi:WD40-like Beta Propeller Repeat